MAIKQIVHKGLDAFHKNGTTKGIDSSHIKRLRLLLTGLDAASNLEDLNVPGWYFHKHSGNKKNEPPRYSLRVSGNWRVTFIFTDGDVYVLDYEDPH